MRPPKALLFFAAVAFTNFILFKFFDFTVPIHIDPVDYTYVTLNLIKSYFVKGEFALWSPESFGGTILGFGGSWDWKVLPFLAFFETMDAIVLFGSVLTCAAGCFFYLMARQVFSYSPMAATVGAIFWAFNPFNMMYIYDHVFCTIFMWVPVIIWALHRFSANPYAMTALLSLIIADQIFTGRMDSLEHMGMIVLLYLLVEPFCQRHSYWATLTKNIAILVVSGILSLLVLAPFLADFFNNFLASARLGAAIGTHAQPLWPPNFFQWIPSPLARGDWIAYLGPVGFFPIVLSLFAKKANKSIEWTRNCIFLAIASCFFVFYYNIFGVFDSLYKALPFHNGIRYTLRFAPPIYFFLSFPLMTGISKLEQAPSLPKLSEYFGRAFGILCFIFAVLVLDRRSWSLDIGLGVFVLLVLQGALFYWGCKRNILRSNFAKFVLVLVCLANSLLPTVLSKWPNMIELHTSTHKNQEFESVVQALENRGEAGHSYRFINDSMSGYGFEGPTLWLYMISKGFQGMLGYEVFTPTDFKVYLQAVFKGSVANQFFHDHNIAPQVNAWRLNNIKYFLGKKGLGYDAALAQSPMVKPIFTSAGHGLTLYEMENSLPRFYFAHQSELASPADVHAKLNARLDSDYDWFKSGVLVEDEKFFAAVQGLTASAGSQGRVEVLHYGANSIRLKVQTAKPAMFVALERFDPWRWKLRVDGKKTPYVRANGLYRAVNIAAGEHELEFYYSLPFYTYILSALGFATLLALCLLGLRFSRRRG